MTYNRDGFTLIELLLAMAIMMILSVIGIGAYTTAMERSRDTQKKGEVNQLAKAIEAFNGDVGRYPLSELPDDAEADKNKLHCYEKDGAVVTNPKCSLSNKLFSIIDGVTTNYMTLPEGPTENTRYVYIASANGSSFALYAALENNSDRDLIIDPLTSDPYSDPWGYNCGTGVTYIACNYKVTEDGLAKTL